MSRRGLIFAFVFSSVLTLVVGLLSNLAATYLAPAWAERPEYIYLALTIIFLITLLVTTYIFSRTLPEQASQTNPNPDRGVTSLSAETNINISFADRNITLTIPFLAPPLPPQGIFGRRDDLRQIFRLLALEDDQARDVPPIALRGMGGIGKTTLSIALAHLEVVQKHFPDGVLWTALGPNPVIRLHLDSWGRALGVDLLPEHDEAACQERLRTALYDRRVLLIVDDVWNTNHGRFFQVAGSKCRTVFTTREVPIANDLATQIRTLRVDILKPEPALALLKSLAPQAVAADEKLASKLCERLEYLPLGLTLAGRFLANEADVPQRMQRLLSELVERREARLKLVQVEGRRGLDEENPVSLQAILGMSVDRLDKTDQERFALLAVFGGEPLTWEINSAMYMWECSIEEAENTVSQLIQRGLVERRGERYWMHALLADYAKELMDQFKL
ncbi:MAG: hypothetical protein H6672_13325 [Anaerolineaceae bacterium]|nr:hypothetical protein [Anaerolineaceae bacterium]